MHRTVLTIFPLNLQTITIAQMLSTEGEGEFQLLLCSQMVILVSFIIIKIIYLFVILTVN